MAEKFIFKGNKMKNRKLSLLGILSVIIFGIISFGCDNSNGGSENNNSDEYYVKYEVNSTTTQGFKIDVTVTNEKNNNMNVSINSREQWEIIIGPVKKGFNAALKVDCGMPFTSLYTKISVSKNNGPFAVKKIDGSATPRYIVQINYTIDF